MSLLNLQLKTSTSQSEASQENQIRALFKSVKISKKRLSKEEFISCSDFLKPFGPQLSIQELNQFGFYKPIQ